MIRITGTPGELAKDNRLIVPDQEIAAAAELTNQDSNSTENEFPSDILLSENPIRSEADLDMLEALTVALNEDRTNGANPESLESIVVYELLQNNSAILSHNTQEDSQCTRSPRTLEANQITSRVNNFADAQLDQQVLGAHYQQASRCWDPKSRYTSNVC